MTCHARISGFQSKKRRGMQACASICLQLESLVFLLDASVTPRKDGGWDLGEGVAKQPKDLKCEICAFAGLPLTLG